MESTAKLKQKENKVMENSLRGKRVLFIGVKFYDYNEEIIRRLKAAGAEVFFFHERDTTIRYGIYNRLFHSRLDAFQARHYQNILQKIEGVHFDYLLVIRGHKMPVSFVKAVKEKNPNIVSIMFQWDSHINSPFLNLPPQLNAWPLFDKVFSFDYRDVEETSALRYAPTFSTDEFKALYGKGEICYDLFYFGNYLPERYQGLLAFKKYAEAHGYTFHHYLYMHWRYYMIERLKGNKLDIRLIKFRMLSRKKYLELFAGAKAIVDVSNGNQTGMAMRVLDALVAGKKVITTNPWIRRDPHYNPEQIAVVDMKQIELPRGFLEEEQKFPQPDFSVDSWINTVFFSA